jgi:hypothetical protein
LIWGSAVINSAMDGWLLINPLSWSICISQTRTRNNISHKNSSICYTTQFDCISGLIPKSDHFHRHVMYIWTNSIDFDKLNRTSARLPAFHHTHNHSNRVCTHTHTVKRIYSTVEVKLTVEHMSRCVIA